MSSDLTFITNEKDQNLKDRFEVLIKDTKFFDCLVGFFYTSGFYAIYKSLEATEKIRVLIGISTSRQTYDHTQAILREYIIEKLNVLLCKLGRTIGFKAKIVISNCVSSERLEKSIRDLIDGKLQFSEIVKLTRIS